jgi:hypothetical protein
MLNNFIFFQDFFVIFIFGHFFCPFFEKVKYSWKKKLLKKPEKNDTIKILMVSYKKNNYQICY